MRRYNTIKITGLAALALALTAGKLTAADREDRGQLSESDYKFVKQAARGGISEVELGLLAQQKGNSDAVRNFGSQMAQDHKKANQELKQIATSKGVTIPSELSHGERSTLDKLQNATGADFDKEYASAMVKDHKEDVKEFKKAAGDLKDPDLRAFAQKTLPTLENHLTMAEQMEQSVKGK